MVSCQGKRLQLGDLDSLFQFLNTAYPQGHRALDRRYWEWKFLKNPYTDEIPYFVLQSHGSFVGTLAYWPAEIVVKGKRTSAARMVDFVVENSFKGIPVARVFRTLTSFAQVNIGINMSEDARRLFTAAGWIDLSERLNNLHFNLQRPKDIKGSLSKLRYWQKSLINLYKRSQVTKSDVDNHQMQIEDTCPEGIDRLLRLMYRQHDVLIFKGRDYLKWRYDDCPINEYRYACYYSKSELKHIFVFGLLNLKNQLTMIIMEVLYDPSDIESLTQFLIRFLRFSKNLAVTRIITVLSSSSLVKRFAKVGFQTNVSDLGLMFYAEDKKLQQQICSSNKIWFVYGDTDRF